MEPIVDANEYIRKRYEETGSKSAPGFTRAYCQDGYFLSIQASAYHYCTPRTTGAAEYSSMELGYTSAPDPLIDGYSETDEWAANAVYPFVPADVVGQLLRKHGGVVYWNPQNAW